MRNKNKEPALCNCFQWAADQPLPGPELVNHSFGKKNQTNLTVGSVMAEDPEAPLSPYGNTRLACLS